MQQVQAPINEIFLPDCQALAMERCKISICHQAIVQLDKSLYFVEITQASPSAKN
jgi:hypothetical protein